MNSVELTENANNILIFLLNNSTMYWRKALDELACQDMTTYDKWLNKVLTYADKKNCVARDCGIRFIKGSIPELGKQYLPHLTVSEVEAVFKVLKENSRILQIGSGRRGLGFIIFSHYAIEVDPTSLLIDPNDTLALATALRDAIANSQTDLKALIATVTEQGQIIAKLEEQMTLQQQQSWY